jgi:hypothetical protein
MMYGIKTKIYTDTKRIPIMAGGSLANKNASKALRKVGYEVFRHYFDTLEKDCLVGGERIKRVIFE